ncbi:hydantoinase/oxoprolinase family protein [Roseomonas sp. BU-1]|uniref:Hydantoinase/oxoprolinase family protein n=1 Tax=Falsiroseomonas selenitidurans TaxID=2716335 RepID=A0ABX1E8R7_9PROT|nr:hydantoinase/oxoprolinase family protein [Falsiroseomonas selenitidurans]
MKRIGIDVGGTFTDVVLVDEAGRVHTAKVPTTPHNRVIGALNGFRRILAIAGCGAAEIGFIGHGSTMATNMVVERTGARTALVTTQGFRDVLELRRIARHDRADLYDLQFDNPDPLVPRRWRHEVAERMDWRGQVDTPLDEAALHAIADRIAESPVEAVAIAFLHAAANPAHERRAADILAQRLPGHFISASHEVNPEVGEYERTSTTVMNAMLGPLCARYIAALQDGLRQEGFAGELLFMGSNGGLADAALVAARPVLLLESGPAGGVSAAIRLGDRHGWPDAILGDMGGTTFDVSLVRGSRAELRSQVLLHSYAVRAPSIDIESIGAGGGSIAWVDAGGGVRIGPQSAGADPGPACYGRGGTRPTVTDCNLLLGYIDPDTFLDGGFKLDRAAAQRAVELHLAQPLGLDTLAAAHAVRAVANALMAQAIRLMTVERGHDPRGFDYLCFGGAGPVHALDLARSLEMARVLVPPVPGLFSALGMVLADRQADLQAAVDRPLSACDGTELEARYAEMEGAARGRLPADAAQSIRRRADCRYAGQPDSIMVDVVDCAPVAIRAAFEAAHRHLWNFTKPDQPVLLNNIRVEARAATGWRGALRFAKGDPAPAPSRTRRVQFGGGQDTARDLPVWRRDDLPEGHRVEGPAVIEEASSSLTLGPGDVARIEAGGVLAITLAVEPRPAPRLEEALA